MAQSTMPQGLLSIISLNVVLSPDDTGSYPVGEVTNAPLNLGALVKTRVNVF